MAQNTTIYVLLLLSVFSAGSVTSAQKSSSIHVKLLSGDSPVGGATVSLSGFGASGEQLGNYQEFTNEAGECEFVRLAGGSYSLRVSKLSFISISDAEATQTTVLIKDGETRAVQSYLTRGGVVSGRLVSTNNEAVIGVPVTALLNDPANGLGFQPPSDLESNGTSISDDRGVFRIYGLRPGTYSIAINAKRDLSLRKDIRSTRYLGGSDSTSSAGIFIGMTEEVNLPDIPLVADSIEACVLLGTVKGSGNKPLPAATISLQGVDDQTVSDQALTNASGDFSFEGLAPGRYRITAGSRHDTYRALTKEATLSASLTTSLAITLSELPLIKGRAYLYRNGKPEPLPMLRTVLLAADGTGGVEFTSGLEGTFSVRTSRTGSFFWSLPALAKNQYLAGISSGDKDITSSPLRLGNAPVNDIAIRVSTGAAAIEGHFPESVPNGCTALTAYAVLLSPAENKVLSWRRADICTGNSFSIYSLSPGRYYLIAVPAGAGMNGPPQVVDKTIKAAVKPSSLNPNDLFNLDKSRTVTRQPTLVRPLLSADQ
jgi:hypothetical protein